MGSNPRLAPFDRPHLRSRFGWSAAVLLLIASPLLAGIVCGDGLIEGDEQCDDGSLLDFDGCTRDCLYEAVQRVTTLTVQTTAAPAALGCTPSTNRFGAQALTPTGANVINTSIADAVSNNRLVQLLDLLHLDDPTGLGDASLSVGFLSGILDPADPTPGGIDSWYLVGSSLVDPDGYPSERLENGTLVARVLKAGPGVVGLSFVGGTLADRNARILAATSTENSVPAPPPDALAPGLVAFDSLNGTNVGEGLCGNLTVGSLATIPVPDALASTGGSPCGNCAGSMTYVSCAGGAVTDSCNSLLDLLVGGCKVVACLATAVNAAQPDVDANGGSSPQQLVFATNGQGVKRVTVIEPNDAYSAYFKFSSERVHITDHLPIFVDGFEDGTFNSWSSSAP